MMANIEVLVAMTEANQSFPRVTHIVDRNGLAVTLKNNKPRYIVVDSEEHETIRGIREVRKKKLEATADVLIEESTKASLELAK